MVDTTGRLPTIGDDDGGRLLPLCRRDPADARDTLAIAAALLDDPDLAIDGPAEEAWWLCGRDAHANRAQAGRRQGSIALADSGYYVSRQGGHHLVIDSGPHGYLNGGHAHADALSAVLHVDGRPLLIDPGTATYTMDPARRDWYRSSQMHNTLALDGRSQSEPDGPFHWRTRTSAVTEQWISESRFDYFQGSHDGYDPLVHRRAMLAVHGEGWFVADHVEGSGWHRADIHWHIGPDWRVEEGGPVLLLRDRDGRVFWMGAPGAVCRVFRADRETGLGFCSPVYGRIVPCTTIRFSREAAVPFSIVTVIGSGDRPPLRLEPASGDASRGWRTAGVLIERAAGRDIALFAAPPGRTEASGAQTPPWRHGAMESDARAILWRRARSGTHHIVALAGGTFGRAHHLPAHASTSRSTDRPVRTSRTAGPEYARARDG
jgi:hypothetical protein